MKQGLYLKRLLKERKYTHQGFADMLGVSRTYLNALFAKDPLPMAQQEKVNKLLDIDITKVSSETYNVNEHTSNPVDHQHTIDMLKKDIERLNALLHEKVSYIRMQEELISVLRGREKKHKFDNS